MRGKNRQENLSFRLLVDCLVWFKARLCSFAAASFICDNVCGVFLIREWYHNIAF